MKKIILLAVLIAAPAAQGATKKVMDPQLRGYLVLASQGYSISSQINQLKPTEKKKKLGLMVARKTMQDIMAKQQKFANQANQFFARLAKDLNKAKQITLEYFTLKTSIDKAKKENAKHKITKLTKQLQGLLKKHPVLKELE